MFPISNTRTFRYDARYRLVRATGKKHNSVVRKGLLGGIPNPDPNDYVPYVVKYAYDEVGNFRRNQEYAWGALSYKAGRLDLFNGDGSEDHDPDPAAGNYRYDANGNTVHTPRIGELRYTHDDQVRYTDMGGGTEVRTLRHADQRVLRFVKKNGVRALGVYLGPWEHHQRLGTTSYTKTMLSVAGHDRHAQLERVLAGSDPDSLPVFYVHGDHLGSGHILTDASGDLLSQEEYLPYGGATDRRDTRNRYRFIGVERDEDTGLCMTGPRTYDPVTGRFLQGDPLAKQTVESAFVYASARPLRAADKSGYQSLDELVGGTLDTSASQDEAPDPEALLAAWTRLQEPEVVGEGLMARSVANGLVGGATLLPRGLLSISSSAGWERGHQDAEKARIFKYANAREERLAIVGETIGESVALSVLAEGPGMAARAGALTVSAFEATVAAGGPAGATELLRPGGKLIGTAGTRESIRVVQGGAAEAERFFQGLSAGGRVVTPHGHPGTLVELPGGGFVGYRPVSASGPPTIDVNIPGVSEITKIKFLP